MSCRTEKEYAVSETVGFILIFGIVMTGIGLVTLYGYPLLLQQQDEANIQNMEKTMIVLQSDFNSLTFKNVPYQETTVQVSGGVLSVVSFDQPGDANEKSFNITTGSGTIILPTTKVGLVQYQSDSQPVIIGLQNGGVVKWQLGGSTMLSEPRWFFDSATGTLVIPIIQIYSEDTFAKSGIGTIQLSVVEKPSIEQTFPDPETITVTYTDNYGDYNTAWKNYLYQFDPSVTIDVEAKIPDVKNIVVKQYVITVISL